MKIFKKHFHLTSFESYLPYNFLVWQCWCQLGSL